MSARDLEPVCVWRSKVDYNDWTDAEPMGSLRKDYVSGVWRPVPADARRDRIVRAAEAFEACERDATDVASLAWANARRELMAAVAAGRATT